VTTRVLLIRHGQTYGNIEGRFCGHAETDLTPLGIAQAKALGQRLRETPIHAAYASDLSRAHLTAHHALEGRGLGIVKDAGLREMHYGEWEGRSGSEIRAQQPDLMRDFFRCLVPAPGGEDVATVRNRTAGTLRRIVGAHPGQTLVIVSHGNAIAAMLAELLGMPNEASWSFAVENTSITRMTFSSSGRVTLLGFNDAAHIEGLASETA